MDSTASSSSDNIRGKNVSSLSSGTPRRGVNNRRSTGDEELGSAGGMSAVDAIPVAKVADEGDLGTNTDDDKEKGKFSASQSAVFTNECLTAFLLFLDVIAYGVSIPVQI